MRSVWWIVLAAVACGALFLAVMVSATDGHLAMPLDDAYIFFQYARMTAAGHPFAYQPEGSLSTGATSLLTVWADSLGYLVGFRDARMTLFALLLGSACLAWSGVSALALGRRLCPRVSWLPPLLLLLNGPLLWGFQSGMDVPLFVALALAWLAAWPEGDARPTYRFFAIGGLLGLTRPDALFLIVPAAIVGLTRFPRRPGWVVPLAGVSVPFLIQVILTGSPQSASMDVKSVLADPGFNAGDWIARGASYLQHALKGMLAGGAVENIQTVHANDGSAIGFHFVPFALGLFVLGVLPGAWHEIRNRGTGPFTLLLVWTALLLAAVSFTVPRDWHWHRYLIPVHAFVLVGVAVGAARAGRLVEAAWKELRPGDGSRLLGGVLGLLSLPGLLFFTVAYGRNCADIYFQHVELAHRFREGDPVRPALLGTHDAGALAYFGGVPLLDLEGLVSQRFRDPGRLGSAGIWEEIEHLEPRERPDVLAVYPNWFESSFLEPHRRILDQRLFRPTIVGGNPMQVYLADWRLAGSGAEPRSPGLRDILDGMIPVGEVDVADVRSEAAAGYRMHLLDGIHSTLLHTARAEDDTRVTDGGRIISGWEEFTVAGAHPGDRLILVSRTHGAFRIRVEVNGEPRGIWVQDRGGRDAWTESAFVIAEGSPDRDGPVRIRLVSDDPHHSAYGSFHYWIFGS